MEKFYKELTLDVLPSKDVQIRIPFTSGPGYDLYKVTKFWASKHIRFVPPF